MLFLAGRFGQGSTPVSSIAKSEGISTAYLEQILNKLKKKGLVRSLRGPQGGYVLTKKPVEIDLKTLFYALVERPFRELEGKSPRDASDTAVAGWLFWSEFKKILDDGLAETTLQNLMDQTRAFKKDKSKFKTPNFNI